MLRPDYMFLVLIDFRNQLYQCKLALDVSVYYYIMVIFLLNQNLILDLIVNN